MSNRIVCPYIPSKLDPRTRAALAPFGAEFYDLTGDDFAYWQLVQRLYAEGRPWLHVEQDMEPTADQVREVLECPEEVCAIRYPYMAIVDLGFLKIGRTALPPIDWHKRWSVLPDGERYHWRDVSAYIMGQLPKIHVHGGLVEHHHAP